MPEDIEKNKFNQKFPIYSEKLCWFLEAICIMQNFTVLKILGTLKSKILWLVPPKL
jgi:hypothetical protein